ncbi:hypothetical protein PHMEG_00014446 [Phytophthora megakarya]|uniref:Uncharacterized protein n=1 Tax=Phytophthora megakarya TaxID=4795 RepID=A0A225W4V1_9STRA|nr:hypothetical protein PHMEG_00014446 [Phytophthora megakarya]
MPRHPWVALESAMSHENAGTLLQGFTLQIDEGDLSHCHVCMLPAPHAICISATCSPSTSTFQCQWCDRVLRCSMLPLVKVETAYSHVTSACPPRKPHMTEKMKKVAQDWAAQGLKATSIWDGLILRFSLDEASTPLLTLGQRLVHYHVAGRRNFHISVIITEMSQIDCDNW